MRIFDCKPRRTKGRKDIEEKIGQEMSLPVDLGIRNGLKISFPVNSRFLRQMDFLIKGHQSLQNMFDNLQLDTQEQVEILNENFSNLENKTTNLSMKINSYYNNKY